MSSPPKRQRPPHLLGQAGRDVSLRRRLHSQSPSPAEVADGLRSICNELERLFFDGATAEGDELLLDESAFLFVGLGFCPWDTKAFEGMGAWLDTFAARLLWMSGWKSKSTIVKDGLVRYNKALDRLVLPARDCCVSEKLGEAVEWLQSVAHALHAQKRLPGVRWVLHTRRGDPGADEDASSQGLRALLVKMKEVCCKQFGHDPLEAAASGSWLQKQQQLRLCFLLHDLCDDGTARSEALLQLRNTLGDARQRYDPREAGCVIFVAELVWLLSGWGRVSLGADVRAHLAAEVALLRQFVRSCHQEASQWDAPLFIAYGWAVHALRELSQSEKDEQLVRAASAVLLDLSLSGPGLPGLDWPDAAAREGGILPLVRLYHASMLGLTPLKERPPVMRHAFTWHAGLLLGPDELQARLGSDAAPNLQI